MKGRQSTCRTVNSTGTGTHNFVHNMIKPHIHEITIIKRQPKQRFSYSTRMYHPDVVYFSYKHMVYVDRHILTDNDVHPDVHYTTYMYMGKISVYVWMWYFETIQYFVSYLSGIFNCLFFSTWFTAASDV